MGMNEILAEQIGTEELAQKYLTFQIVGQHYGISIDNVIEIVQMQQATELPELPAYAKGVINLRGRVVPLIDVNLRFGKPEKEYSDRTCIIIVSINELYVGFIVDAVEEVLDIPESQISPPPVLSSDGSARYVTGIGKLEDMMVLLLNPQLLLSDEDLQSLGQLV